MKKLIRISLILVVVLGLLTAIGLGGFSWWIMRNMGPDMWVTQLEKNTNCRGQIDDAKLSLFTKPTRLSFTGVKIAPRDAEVDKPLSQRTPMPDGVAQIFIPEIILEVKLQDLLNRRLFVEQLRLISPVVQEAQDSRGKSTLEALFKKPDRDEHQESSVAAPVNQTTASPSAEKKKSRSSDDFAFTVSNASIEGGSLTIQNSGTTIRIRDLEFILSGIDIDHTDLVNHNRITAKLSSQIQVEGMARIGGVKRPAELANMKINGDSVITPIDPATGEWIPYSVLKLTIAQGSTLAGHITMGDAAGKEMKKLLEYGIDLSPVPVGGPLLEPVVLNGAFKNNIFSILTDTRFAFPDYEVVIERKSYVNAAQDIHKMDLRLSCGQELQARLQDGVSKAKLGESITRGLFKALSDERGRMTFDIESEGPLSDPEIKPKLDRILKNLMRGEGLEDLFKGLLKKL
jgi:hypothetical protein